MYLIACRTCSTIIFPHSTIYHWFNSFNILSICGVVFAITVSLTPYCQDENGKDVKCMYVVCCNVSAHCVTTAGIFQKWDICQRRNEVYQIVLCSCLIHETSFGLKKIVYREVRCPVLIFQPAISGPLLDLLWSHRKSSEDIPRASRKEPKFSGNPSTFSKKQKRWRTVHERFSGHSNGW